MSVRPQLLMPTSHPRSNKPNNIMFVVCVRRSTYASAFIYLQVIVLFLPFHMVMFGCSHLCQREYVCTVTGGRVAA